MSKNLKLLRRGVELEKIGDLIKSQIEIQFPCDFEDEDDYADFCIGQGISFYYNDDEDEEYKYPTEDMFELRDEIEDYMQKKYYNYLVGIYNDYDCEK